MDNFLKESQRLMKIVSPYMMMNTSQKKTVLNYYSRRIVSMYCLMEDKFSMMEDQRNKAEYRNYDVRKGKYDVSFVLIEENRNEEEHYDDMLEKCQRKIELLEYLLKEPEYEIRIAVREEECLEVPDNENISQLIEGEKEDFCFHNNDFSAGTEKDVNEYVVVIEKKECDWFFDNEFEIQGQKMNIDQDDVFKDIEAKSVRFYHSS